MTPDQLITIVLVLTALIVMICLAYMWHADQDAELGRELRAAAGSESGARMAIESANLDRLLSAKYENEFERAMRRGTRTLHNKLPRNVLRFPPITDRGREVKFTPNGDAA